MATTVEVVEEASARSFGGTVKVFSHNSPSLKCTMKFSVFIPPQGETEKVPVLYFLSGLTCTEQNFITKAGAQRKAAELGIMLVCPDTSPRGVKVEGDDEGWDFGTGAGFYVNATEDKWKANYNMYTYVTEELPQIVKTSFNADETRVSISGHSMGGHGALICALKNPGMYKSCSAFAPICHPCICPWGKKAFTGYMGSDESTWKPWDATELIKAYDGPPLSILVDQGKEDGFLEAQLFPQDLVAASGSTTSVSLRMHEGYDHSYYFISSFVDDHLDHHAKYLKA